jgi:excisionase family DNA binding protein
MVPSTKLITIREAANRLGLKESTIRKYILKRQIAYVKPSVQSRAHSYRGTRTDSGCWPEACHPSGGVCPMSRWQEFRREPVAGEWTRKQKRGYHRVRSLLWFWECHKFQVLWVTLSTAEGGNAEKLTYHHKQLRQRIERQLGYSGLEYYQVRTEEGHGVLHIFWAWRVPDGERPRHFWISQQWLSVAMAGPPWRSGCLDQGLPAKPPLQEPAEPLRHQPIRPGSMRLREHVLVLETIIRLSHREDVGRDAKPMADTERLPAHSQTDRGPSHRLSQDLGRSAVRPSDLVQ